MTTTESAPGRAERVGIGEAARRSGLSIDTLRYYDREGLLGDLPRDAGGRRVLTSGGRTLVQGALGYLLAMGVVPIPGARTPEQARENAAALHLGPLGRDDVDQIDALLADSPERR